MSIAMLCPQSIASFYSNMGINIQTACQAFQLGPNQHQMTIPDI